MTTADKSTMADLIHDKLTAAFQPESLEVEDESWRHEGHSGARPGGETHFKVEMVCAAFTGKNRVARQRDVYRALKDEMEGSIHALALTTRAPGE
jgi:BolA family transcriptional regulator, general stress-responsive regulator